MDIKCITLIKPLCNCTHTQVLSRVLSPNPPYSMYVCLCVFIAFISLCSILCFDSRNIALVVILTRAGLGLDPKALKKLSFGVLRLAFTPCLVETVCAAVTSHYILGFHWTWGFMLGQVHTVLLK